MAKKTPAELRAAADRAEAIEHCKTAIAALKGKEPNDGEALKAIRAALKLVPNAGEVEIEVGE